MNRSEILREAERCVCGDREQDYGSPEDNFSTIAALWTEYIGAAGVVITSLDVAMMMSLLKIARIRNGGGTGDSFVDLAGYAACGGEILGRMQETEPAQPESGGVKQEEEEPMKPEEPRKPYPPGSPEALEAIRRVREMEKENEKTIVMPNGKRRGRPKKEA